MVFSKGLHLARQSLAKTFTHGYAQSIVAGAQSSYATQTTSFGSFGSNFVTRLGKPGAHQSNSNAFQQPSQHPVGSAKPGSADGSGSDLTAYYAAWQKHQQRPEDKEWNQFQFAKRIGWKAPTTVPEGRGRTAEQVGPEAGVGVEDGGPLERAYTTGAVDDFKRVVEEEGIEDRALAQIGDAIAKEAEQVKEEAELSRTSEDALSTAPSYRSYSGRDSPSSVIVSSATSVSEVDSYTAHLLKLANGHQYAEIPAVFESMLAAGITPTSTAYNTLLLAAVHVPKSKHHVVSKALDVYSDMLRRRVLPDTVTYATLLELLSSQALDVLSSKRMLEEKRERFGAPQRTYLFPSDEKESSILSEDDSMSLAVKVFDASTVNGITRAFSPETYSIVIEACAQHGRVSDMVRIYTHMESIQVVPPANMFPSMIKAFASCGDLRSSVECYDEYKALAISNDNGQISMDRNDDHVYSGLIKAYSICDRLPDGLKFLDKLKENMASESSRFTALRQTVALETLLPHQLERGRYREVLQEATQADEDVFRTLCIHAADKGQVHQATEAFNLLQRTESRSLAASAMLACHVRLGDVEAATQYWELLSTADPKDVDLIQPTVMFTNALIEGDKTEQIAQECRQMFARARAVSVSNDTAEHIDEALEVIGNYLIGRSIFLPSKAATHLLGAMIDNSSMVGSLAAQLLAGIGPEGIAELSNDELSLVFQAQGGMITYGSRDDIGGVARFSHLVEVAMTRGLVFNERTTSLVEKILPSLDAPDLALRWQSYRYPVTPQLSSPVLFVHSPVQTYEDTYDPYASTTDFRGSGAIVDELEKTFGRHATHLDEALVRLRNMRRSGRHPRYITYAKLMTAAAKENRINLAHDLLSLARQDMPYLQQYPVVHHGWVSLLDAMVGACLTVGKRELAAKYHQDLLNMNAAPSANTFGLYITTLKGSTKTFDEATEAVRIFLRAKSEGVEPSSFLYNALIGKLGKARRIDDCLLYFAEMRNLGIKPTSVTYGTIVNALCRVSDDKFAEELFEEMESMPNYKPRPAPYNSLMQYFLSTKRDRSKVLAYWERMKSKGIQPTMHTYKLLIDTHATLDPIDMPAAEAVLEEIKHSGLGHPEAVHYAALIHAKGCVLHDVAGARAIFNRVLSDGQIRPQPCIYQALSETLVVNHRVADTEPLLASMRQRGVELTPYIANALIHGWAMAGELKKAKRVFGQLGADKREPSTYEAMVRACLAGEDREGARAVVAEACARGYPAAVAGKIADLVRG